MKVLVILGHRLQDDGNMDATLKCRLDTALTYIKNEVLPDGKVILSGGVANKKAGRAEGDVMYEYLLKMGVPEQILIREVTSKTTKQNAKFSKGIIEELGEKQITICTSQYHFDRKILNPVKLFQKALGKEVKIEKLVAPNING